MSNYSRAGLVLHPSTFRASSRINVPHSRLTHSSTIILPQQRSHGPARLTLCKPALPSVTRNSPSSVRYHDLLQSVIADLPQLANDSSAAHHHLRTWNLLPATIRRAPLPGCPHWPSILRFRSPTVEIHATKGVPPSAYQYTIKRPANLHDARMALPRTAVP